MGRMTPVVKNLLIINIGIYLAMVLLPHPIGDFIWRYMFLYFPGSDMFIPSQIVTYMFVHFPDSGVGRPGFFSTHLLFNMITLWVFGTMVEMVWGAKRFLQYYIVCGIGAVLVHIGVMYLSYYDIIQLGSTSIYAITGGASGAIYGLLVAAAYLFPNNYVAIYGVIPIKIKYLAIGLIIFDLVMGFGGGGTTAHFAHIGGALVGFLWLNIGKLRPRRRF